MKAHVIGVMILSVLLVAAPASARKWTDSTGTFSVEAELVEIKAGKVVLKKSTGSVIAVPISRLSEADQHYIESLDKPPEKQPAESGRPAQSTGDSRPKGKTALRLEKGTPVSIQAKGQPVGQVLAQIAQRTGLRVRVVDNFRSDDAKILSKPISLNLKGKTFLEAVEQICTATGVQFKGVQDGVVMLSSEKDDFGHTKRVGPPTANGAFLVYPAFDDFFGRLQVVIRSEPWIVAPQVKSCKVKMVLPDGKQFDVDPERLDISKDMQTGDLTIGLRDLTFGIRPAVPKGTKKAKSVSFEAHLEIGTDWKTLTTAPLGGLVPQKLEFGDGSLSVTRAFVREADDREEFVVELEAFDLELDRSKISLLDSTKKPVEPTGFQGGSSTEGEQQISWTFDPAGITGEPLGCSLQLEVPGEGQKTIGPVGKLAAKPVPASTGTVWIVGAGREKHPGDSEDYVVTLTFEGFFPPWEQAGLAGPQGPIENTGLNAYGKSLRIMADPKNLPAKPESLRVTFPVPSSVTEHVISGTFEDVPIAE